MDNTMERVPALTIKELSHILDINDIMVREDADKSIPFVKGPLLYSDICDVRIKVDSALKFEELDKIDPNRGISHGQADGIDFKEDFSIEYKMTFEVLSIFLERNRNGDLKFYKTLRYTGCDKPFKQYTIFDLFLKMAAYDFQGNRLFDIVH